MIAKQYFSRKIILFIMVTFIVFVTLTGCSMLEEFLQDNEDDKPGSSQETSSSIHGQVNIQYGLTQLTPYSEIILTDINTDFNVSGVQVSLFKDNAVVSVNYSQESGYAFEGLTPGLYSVIVNYSNFTATVCTLNAEAEGDYQRDLTVPAYKSFDLNSLLLGSVKSYPNPYNSSVGALQFGYK
ncbi:hypothetical protein ACFLZV_07275, partial [Candidatus Margulisiibacteriota bacterium]